MEEQSSSDIEIIEDILDVLETEAAEKKEEAPKLVTKLPNSIQEVGKSKSTKTKRMSVYTKSMHMTMPDLKWLPGESKAIRLSQIDQKQNQDLLNEFISIVQRFKTMSLMLFVEPRNDEKKYIPFRLAAFGSPLLTIIFDVKELFTRDEDINFPQQLVDLASDSSITVVYPGDMDFIYSDSSSNIMIDFAKYSTMRCCCSKFIGIDSFLSRLNIISTGKDICEHMKLIYWVFQIKFESHMHGSFIITPFSDSLKKMIHKYSSLLVYLYWALKQKEELYMEDRTYGVNLDPYYLQDVLIDYHVIENINRDELIKKLIGIKSYPNPPLPDTTRSQKKPKVQKPRY